MRKGGAAGWSGEIVMSMLGPRATVSMRAMKDSPDLELRTITPISPISLSEK